MERRFLSEVKGGARPETMKSGVVSTLMHALALALMLSAGSCEESLPPLPREREVTEMTFGLNVRSVEGYVVLPQGGDGPMDADGGVDIRVKNLYDDVLSDPEQIRADVTIWQSSHPERRATFQVGKEALQDPSMLLGNLVVIRPGQELRLLKQWSHSFGAAIPFWTVPDSSFETVISGEKKALTFRVFYTARVSVRIFRTRPTLYSGDQAFMLDYRAQ